MDKKDPKGEYTYQNLRRIKAHAPFKFQFLDLLGKNFPITKRLQTPLTLESQLRFNISSQHQFDRALKNLS